MYSPRATTWHHTDCDTFVECVFYFSRRTTEIHHATVSLLVLLVDPLEDYLLQVLDTTVRFHYVFLCVLSRQIFLSIFLLEFKSCLTLNNWKFHQNKCSKVTDQYFYLCLEELNFSKHFLKNSWSHSNDCKLMKLGVSLVQLWNSEGQNAMLRVVQKHEFLASF